MRMVSDNLHDLLQPLFDLVLPERCRSCGCYLAAGAARGLCPDCMAQIRFLGDSVCRACGSLIPSGVGHGYMCGFCLQDPPSWDLARSIVYYDSPVKELLYRLKYQADTTVLPAIEQILAEHILPVISESELIIPVPMHARRLRQRGINQAIALARLFAGDGITKLRLNLLKRQRNTVPQTGLSGRQRRNNLKGAFALQRKESVEGKRVCVVDDVYTTGTTVGECSRVLKSAGAVEVNVVTLARVVMNR